ncbi:hypothetical protein BC834DRAFT_875543 [Gloeopeniophorella convolvens]|nr:hypothetical protein BC834DRAFT_875543 [Gloeopeniophorella convolvens]
MTIANVIKVMESNEFDSNSNSNSNSSRFRCRVCNDGQWLIASAALKHAEGRYHRNRRYAFKLREREARRARRAAAKAAARQLQARDNVSGQPSRQEGSSRVPERQRTLPNLHTTSAPPGRGIGSRTAQPGTTPRREREAALLASSPAATHGRHRGQLGAQENESLSAPAAIAAGGSAAIDTREPEATSVSKRGATTGAVAPQGPHAPAQVPAGGERAGSTAGVAAAEYIDQVATACSLDDARRRDLHEFSQHPAEQMILQSAQLAAMEQRLEEMKEMKGMFENISNVVNKVAASTVPPWSQ